jgi:hypothetical protein
VISESVFITSQVSAPQKRYRLQTGGVACLLLLKGRRKMEHRPLIDQLTGAMIEKKEKTEAEKPHEPTSEEVQGLAFKPGEKLVDSVTGKEVTILAGKRAFGTVPGPEGS